MVRSGVPLNCGYGQSLRGDGYAVGPELRLAELRALTFQVCLTLVSPGLGGAAGVVHVDFRGLLAPDRPVAQDLVSLDRIAGGRTGRNIAEEEPRTSTQH